MTVWSIADQGTWRTDCQPKINTTMQKLRLHLCDGIIPHIDYKTIRMDPISSQDVYQYFPVGHHRNEWSSRHFQIWNGPTEALEYVQAYIDDLLVITRGTLEDHLAKLKGPQEVTQCRTENNRC
jgi:hypothetical protein